MSYYADHTIRKYDANGTVIQSFPIAGGVAGLAFAPNGDLFVSTGGDASILKITPAGVVGSFAPSAPGFPFGMAVGPDGGLYVAESANNLIRRYDRTTAQSSVHVAVGLNGPSALAFDAAGNLYVANQLDGSIRKFDSYGADMGPLVPSGLPSPSGLAFNALGMLFVTCQGDNSIKQVDPSGFVSPFSSALLNGPVGLAFDAAGNLYVANQHAGTVVKFDPAATPTTFVGPAGQALFIAFTDDNGVPLPLPPGPGLSCVPPPGGAVSRWPGEGTANDVVSTNHGTLMFGATFAPGIVGQAYKLDGKHAYVSIPNTPNLNPGTGDFTVCAWAKTSFRGESFNKFVLCKLSTGSDIQFSLGYRAPLNQGGVPVFVVGIGSGNFRSAAGTTDLADGNWHFLAGVRHGLSIELYEDGVLVGSNTLPSLYNLTGNNAVTIGGRAVFSNTPYFKGLIDEPEYYSRALSAGEIASMYRCALATHYDITASAGPGGTISPSGVQSVVQGADQLYTFAPAACNVVVDVVVDGVSKGPSNDYKFVGVQGDHTIDVRFGRAVAPTPVRMDSWWSFDDATGTGGMRDLGHFGSGLNSGTLLGGASVVAGKVGQALHCGGVSDYMRVTPAHGTIWVGDCGFGVDAWVKLDAPPAGRQAIFEDGQGASIFLQDGRLGFTNIVSSMAPLTHGVWHHVAVTDQGCVATKQTSFYVDGVLVQTIASKNPYSPPSQAVFIGRGFGGSLDEVDVFRASSRGVAGDSAFIRKIWAAGCAGKRREFVRMPFWSYVPNPTGSTAYACADIVNLTSVTNTYGHAVDAPTCPNVYSVSSGASAIAVPSGASGRVPVQIQRLSGNLPMCLVRFDATNTASQNYFFTESVITGGPWGGSSPSACQAGGLVPASTIQSRAAATSVTTVAQFTLRNDSTDAVPVDYRIEALNVDSMDPSDGIALNGLPVGTPITGSANVPAQDSVTVNVNVYVDDNSPFLNEQIVLFTDQDGDGILDPTASQVVEAAEDTTAPVLGAPPVADRPRTGLATSPNPFRGQLAVLFELADAQSVDVGVFDVTGRRVRTLAAGYQEAGVHRFVWDGRGEDGRASNAGIYFVRLERAGARLATKIVQVR